MGGIINFFKELFGIESAQSGFIGLSSFGGGSKNVYDTIKPKKTDKKELSLSEMLRRS